MQLGNLVYGSKRLPGLLFDLLFGQVFLVNLDNLFDRTVSRAQLFSNGNQRLQNYGRAGNGLQYSKASTFQPLGNTHFLFARQQRYEAHLAQIHAHRITGLFRRRRGLVEFRIFAGCGVMLRPDIRRLGNVRRGMCQLCVGSILVESNAFALERGEGAVNLFGGMFFRGERVVHLIVEQIALFFAQFN